MAKKLFSKLSVLAVLMAFLASCSKTSDYIQVIPADATTLASIQFKTLADKAGLNEKENEAAKQKMLEAMKSEINAATYQQLEKIIHNPDESGIDISSPFYLFQSPSFPYPSLVGKVNNIDDLRTSLDMMAKEEIFQPVEEAEGYCYSTTKGGLLAFNESSFLLVSIKRSAHMDKAKERIAALMSQTAENSIATSGVFQKMEKEKNDINFFSNLKAVPSAYFTPSELGIPAEIQPEDLAVVGGLNFEKGRIVFKGEYYTEKEEAKAILDRQFESYGEINGTFTKYFPSSTLAYACFNLKGDKCYELLAENKEFRKNISIAKAEEMKELFHAIKGDVSIGLINVAITHSPTFVLFADFNDEAVLEKIYQNKQSLGLKRGEDIQEIGKNEYVFKQRNNNIFYGIKDKKLYATNDEMVYKNIDKPADSSIKDTPFASEMDDKSGFMAINSDAILDLPLVKMAAGFGGKKLQTLIEQAKQVSYLAGSVEGNTFQLELSLKNKDVNALKQLTDFAKLMYGM